MEGHYSTSSSGFVDGSVDPHGRSVSRAHTGGWKASLLILGMNSIQFNSILLRIQFSIWCTICCVWWTYFITFFFAGVEIAERFAYTGIRSNLVTYLTDVLHQSTATAAKNVNDWSGVASMLPFLGAFVADSYLGRYWTITASSVIYLLVSIYFLLFLKSFQKNAPRSYTATSGLRWALVPGLRGNCSTKTIKDWATGPIHSKNLPWTTNPLEALGLIRIWPSCSRPYWVEDTHLAFSFVFSNIKQWIILYLNNWLPNDFMQILMVTGTTVGFENSCYFSALIFCMEPE